MRHTFVMIKPEALKFGIVGNVIGYFETAGFSIVKLEMITVDRNLIAAHYIEHHDKDIYELQISRFIGKSVIAMALYAGPNIVDPIAAGRNIIGNTYPAMAEKGTIRGDYRWIDANNNSDELWNVVHASDSVGAARRELALWFPDEHLDIDIKNVVGGCNPTYLMPPLD